MNFDNVQAPLEDGDWQEVNVDKGSSTISNAASGATEGTAADLQDVSNPSTPSRSSSNDPHQ